MIMSEQTREAFGSLFSYIYKGDQNASILSFAIMETLHVWDDLIDKDKELTDTEINTAFLNSLVLIGGSPLWGPDMAQHMLNVYLRWSDANKIEKDKESTDNDLAKAWMLRASCYDLFVLLANKLYGREWAEGIGPTVRKTYGETLEDFIKEMRNA